MRIGRASIYRGARIITCDNKDSVEFLIAAVNGLASLWEGSKVAAMVTSAWIPPPLMEISQIPKLIEKHNVGLSTENWCVLNSSTTNNGLVLRVATDMAGVAFLRSREGLLSFGLRKIHFSLPQSKFLGSQVLA